MTQKISQRAQKIAAREEMARKVRECIAEATAAANIAYDTLVATAPRNADGSMATIRSPATPEVWTPRPALRKALTEAGVLDHNFGGHWPMTHADWRFKNDHLLLIGETIADAICAVFTANFPGELFRTDVRLN